jgi:hypothetical protein
MMQATDLWNGHDLAIPLNLALVRGILFQPQVCSGTMIIDEVALENSSQVSCGQNHNLIQAIPPNRADQPFCKTMLAGGPGNP